MQTRLQIFAFLFLGLFLSLVARLFYWQVIEGKQLSRQARSQYEKGGVITAPRGEILASDGTWLVARAKAWLVYVSLPRLTESSKKIANQLAPFFVEDSENEELMLEEVDRLIRLLDKEGVVWVPLKHKVTSQVKSNIEALAIDGIGFDPEEDRVYPEASSAAHLLGFVGKNSAGLDQGYNGLEGYYDLILSGKPGFLARESDAKGAPILIGNSRRALAIEGVNLKTHLDKAIQLSVEKKLAQGIEKYDALGGTVIVVNPENGAVLAMSSQPTYDPAKYYDFSNDLFRNPAVSDSFEPGSIFKVLVMAAALDAGVIEPDTKCNICDGPLKVDKYYIDTWNSEYFPDSTMTEVLVRSDNVGMVFVGQRLGADKLYDYLDKFGIGRLTGIDLQGEMTPKLRDKGTWNVVDLATASFGQGVAVTPLQIIKAVSAIANKGLITTPQVVDSISGDGWEEDVKPEYGERVISEKAASLISVMMAEAARSGEAKWTHKRGFKVAGKTGTAQIPIAGHYDKEKTIASFVGFAPFDDPKFLMLVTLKEPKTSPWASETAAPLWYDIAQELFFHFGIHPEN